MRCSVEHQSKSRFAGKMKSYFVLVTCGINIVTVLSVIVQLVIDHRTLALEIDGTIEVKSNEINKLSPKFGSIQESILFGKKVKFTKNIIKYVSDSQPLMMPHREVGVEEGGFLDMTCQLRDGSQWSKCNWKHGLKSLSIERNHDRNGYEDIQL